MAVGPRQIALNRCCCPEDEGCLEGVCFVTIEFENVQNATISTDPDADAPPALHETQNTASDPDGGAYGGDPADVACGECTDWNREWELFLISGEGLGEGDPNFANFTFALGQAGGGFQAQRQVYDHPEAGNACFPCAEVGDDTGIVLDIICRGNDVSATLVLWVKGCETANWHWNFYRPVFFNQNRTQGSARRADSLLDIFQTRYKETHFQSHPCYTPVGLCKTDPAIGDNPGEAFPCFVEGANDVSKFYDKTNCYWSSFKDDAPGAGPCTEDTSHYRSIDFGAIVGGGTEKYLNIVGAVGGDVWRLSESGGAGGSVRYDVQPCAGSPLEVDEICLYDVFLRWGENTSAIDRGKVTITTLDPGSGPAVGFETGVGGVPELPFNAGSFDDNTTHTIDTFGYRRLGRIKFACDATLRFEVTGPAEAGTSMDFDDLVIHRIPTPAAVVDSDRPKLRFYLCEAPISIENPTDCQPCKTNEQRIGTIAFENAAGGGVETYITPYDQAGENAADDDVWRLEASEDLIAGLVAEEGSLCLVPPAPPAETICTYEVYLRWGFNDSVLDPGNVAIYSLDEGSGPVVDWETGKAGVAELPFNMGSLEDFTTDVILGNRYRLLGKFSASCDATIRVEVRGPSRPEGAKMDFDEIVLKRIGAPAI